MNSLLEIVVLALMVAVSIEARESGGVSRYCKCPPDYDPVCATNRKVYDNECEMRCDYKYVGPKLEVLKRGTTCPMCGCGPGPNVCGANFVTYASLCDLKCDLTYKHNYVVHQGACAPKRS